MEKLGPYRPIEKLASGVLADVWLANLIDEGGRKTQVLVKAIRPQLAKRREFVDLLLSEARLASKLEHPGIARVLEPGMEGDCYYLATEYVPGVNLNKMAFDAQKQNRTIPMPLVARILAQAATALAYAHQARDAKTGKPLKIVHGDIKPTNILVLEEGGVRLVDFGLAKACSRLAAAEPDLMKGRHTYLAPEQAEGKAVDGRADLFALGVVGFELLTGARLFQEDSDLAATDAQITSKTSTASNLNPKVPAALYQVLLKALARNPSDRYPDGDALAAALEDFIKASRLAAAPGQLAAFMHALYPRRLSPIEMARSTPSAAQALPGETAADAGEAVDESPEAPADDSLEEPASPPASQRRRRMDSEPPRGVKEQVSFEELRAIQRKVDAEDAAERSQVKAAVRKPKRKRRFVGILVRLVLAGGLVVLGILALPDLRRAMNRAVSDGPSLAHEAGDEGTLRIESEPHAQVFFGKRLLGTTTIEQTELPLGHQRLRFVNDAEVLDQSVDVNVTAGQPVLVHPKFPKGQLSVDAPPGKHYRVVYKDETIGRLPGPGIRVCAGTYQIVLVDEESGKRETRTVTVKAE